MANFTNNEFFKVTTKTTVPAPANGTGTIETEGTGVIGTGTSFRSEMRKGSWLVKIGSDEIRVVERVESDTLAILREAFTVDIAALTTPSIISNTSLNIKTLSVGILTGLNDGELNGVVLDNGTSIVFTKEGNDKDGFKSFIDPVIIDAATNSTTITVTIQR